MLFVVHCSVVSDVRFCSKSDLFKIIEITCTIDLFQKSILWFLIQFYCVVFGPKRDENGEWRRLHNEELHSLYRLPNIVRVIKYRRLR